MFKKIFRISYAFLLISCSFLVNLAAQPVVAAGITSSYFESFNADYYLSKDETGGSVLRVVEEITVVFPPDSDEHGITRQIPYLGPTDLTDDKTIDLKATRDGKEENIAAILHHSTKTTSGEQAYYFDVRIGNANRTVSDRQVYTLEYTYRNVIINDPDYHDIQELYWNANGTGWEKTIRSLTARVHFGEDIKDKYTGDVACYVGRYGISGQSRCEISEIDDGVEFTTIDKPLSSSENLTFALGFKPNTFQVSDDGYTVDTKQYTNNRLEILLIVGIIVGAALIVSTSVAYMRSAEKRKYYKSYFVKPEYTPPHGFLVAEMAENYIGSAAGNKQVATLMELAVHHQIEMVKTEEDGLFNKKKTVWKIRIKTDKLKKEQAIVLKILAGSDTPLHNGQEIIVKSHTATSELTKLASNFTKTIKRKLKTAGLMEDKPKKKTSLATANAAAGAVWLVVWMFVLVFTFEEEAFPNYVVLKNLAILLPVLLVLIIAVAVVTIVVNLKISNLEKHTLKGLEYSRYMDGLKMYIKMAEAERLQMLQSVKGTDTTNEGIVKIYEKLLPYAVIFKLEKSWLEELSRYYELEDVSAPIWYVGIGTFSARDFSSAMTSISSSASSAIISSSSSSSGGSGSFGGGGFSGGGGGGGGGGTW